MPAKHLVPMKTYLFLLHGPDYAHRGFSPEELQSRMGQWFAWTDRLRQAGAYVAGEALHSPIREVTGEHDRVVTDKAGSELKEIIGGFYIVRAADLAAATALTEGFPDYDLGGRVEIRETVVFDGQDE